MRKNINNGEMSDIAIIGMGCFFPKSSGLKQYWRLLFRGIDAITDVPETHWSPNDYFDTDPKKPDHVYCARGGFLPHIDFDPVEFGIPPATLQATDTSQLLALLCAKAALSDAGYGDNADFNRDRTSVILGVTGTQELVIPLSSRLGHPIWRKTLLNSGISPEKTEEIVQDISNAYVPWQENSFPGLLGNVVAGRITNRLDLGGTNCVVDAACASSLSAVHLASMELISDRCDMVVTGGADTLNDIFMHMCFSKTGVLSPSGNARPFSHRADGTVLGEGIGILILKRLDDAERDQDRIYAVLKSIGSASDGRSQSIYAPRVEGQVRALKQAYHLADVDPKTVELIEAHGTGTRVGDKVELQSLKQFIKTKDPRNERTCALGSVKSNIGHTKAAAGVAGLIKAALALHHKVLPPTLKTDKPDPDLGIEQSPFYLNTEPRPWFQRTEHPRRSGVSAFGFGGSNFHAVLEEYRPQKRAVSWDGTVEIFALSGATKKILQNRLETTKDRIKRGIPVAAVAAQSRRMFSPKDPHRLLMRLDLSEDTGSEQRISVLFDHAFHQLSGGEKLQAPRRNDVYYGSSESVDRIAFMFPGQGSQYIGMGKDLVCMFPEALAMFDSVDRISGSARRLGNYLYPTPTYPQEPRASQESRLRSTDIAQPAIGVISLSMLKILTRFGVMPDAVCGHSFGELIALCAAGWIDADTALRLAVYRGEYMASAGKSFSGAMLAVSAPLTQLESVIQGITPATVLSNRNSPTQGVLSGTIEAIDTAEEKCRRLGFRTKRLPVSTAFHTRFMESARQSFHQRLDTITMVPTDMPVLSNQTGGPYPKDVEQAKTLLSGQLVHPVDFLSNVRTLFDLGIRTFVEVGPGTVLTGLVKSILTDRPINAFSVDASAGRDPGLWDLAATLCRLAASGCPLDLTQWEDAATEPGRQRMVISLNGANYRLPASTQDSGIYQTGTVQWDSDPGLKVSEIDSTGLKTDGGSIQFSPDQKDIRPMEKKPKNPEIIADALRVAKEGLSSIEALQMQTADAHKKFLETQAEATRTLQEMMRTTQQMTRSLIHDGSLSPPPAPVVENRSELPAIDPVPKTANPQKRESESASLPMETKPADSQPPKPDALHGDVARILLEVVGRLTGYPEEMLDMEMDIESDLGIDSIKRVEILSTLEETLPGLPKVSPDQMGTLKTLGQIVDYLVESDPDVPQPQPVEEDLNTISQTLLTLVSRLTGYPEEMLDMEMDIESDLGIDSIKRVEILSTLEETLPGLPKVSPDQMGTLKTLGQIVDYLTQGNRVSEQMPRGGEPSAVSAGVNPEAAIERHILISRETPYIAGPPISLPSDGTVFVSPQSGALSESIVARLRRHGIHALGIDPDRSENNDRSQAAGLIILPGTDMPDAFRLARNLGPELQKSGAAGGAVFATLTRMDGRFGLTENRLQNPVQGGLAGLLKTAHIEWPQVLCRAFDVHPDWQDTQAIADTVVSELLHPDNRYAVEIGLDEISRHTLALKSDSYPEGMLRLETGDPVIVTGGARGITAAAAIALAEAVHPTLLLLGRSPRPSPEPEWLQHVTDEAEMKRAILTHEFSGATPTPLALQKAYGKYAANRDISQNLKTMRSAGATVIYHPVDIRNPSEVEDALAAFRSDHGPIKAIIHGAGILNDRWIVDKTMDQFHAVFDTKVEGFKNLLDATRNDPLSYLVLFSSVAGRAGNKGQADYAMANEALNKIAQQESVVRPACRVMAINWGPWDGGMVSAGIKKEFLKSGVSLIPIESGTRAMLDEMKGHPEGPAEVVLGAPQLGESSPSMGQAATPSTEPRQSVDAKNHLKLSFKRDIDIEQYPILRSHVLDGKPVVPLALIAEWLGNGALHQYPGLILSGLDELRLLNGIRMDVEKIKIRLFAGKLKRQGAQFEVDVELRDGVKEGCEVIHSTAKAILAETLSHPPNLQISTASKSYARSMDDVYEQILFHGDDLRGIQHIRSLSPEGMTARITAAPSPGRWIKTPLRSRWILDPLLLDSAFQMATIWCYEERGNVSLPGYCASYRQYCETFPTEGVTAVLEVQAVGDLKMTGNFTFLNDTETILARLEGYEAIMDPALIKAFKAG